MEVVTETGEIQDEEPSLKKTVLHNRACFVSDKHYDESDEALLVRQAEPVLVRLSINIHHVHLGGV